MKKPNFLVIGAQKSGTTNLCSLLSKHPEIFISDPKEPHFFAKDELYKKGWDWYYSLFENASEAKAIGEGSTGYTLHTVFPLAPTRIARDLPDAKLIYVVRDPLERMQSEWMQRRGDGSQAWGFGKTLRRLPRMVDASCYWRQLNYYRQHFSDSQILLLFFEDLRDHPNRVLARCFEFLEVDPQVEVNQSSHIENASIGKLAETSFSVWARHNPAAKKMGRLFPKSVRTAIRSLGRREITQYPEWDSTTLEWVLYEIGADAAQFLEFANKPGDYWKLGLHRAAKK